MPPLVASSPSSSSSQLPRLVSSASSGVVSDFPVVEIARSRLYFTCFTRVPLPQPGFQFVCTDRSLVYWNFFLDFGPMNLGQTYRFCEMIQNKMQQHPEDKIVYYCAGNHGQRRANSIMLICAYQMLIMGRGANESFKPFAAPTFTLPSFHDATPCHCTYELTVLDCLQGLDRAIKLGFCDFTTFNVDEYEHFEKVESGDLSWIFPGKFVAFAGPHQEKSYDACYPKCTPDDYVDHFKQRGVGLVVRLNKKYYDEARFTRHGIAHEELYYPDGSNPSLEILERFLALCESRPAGESIAVHCKAGLGRTGTCIGAYAMKHWGFTSKEVIGWMRLCRPGSVIGPQQQYMDEIQDFLHRAGRMRSTLGGGPSPRHFGGTVAAVMPALVQKQQQQEAEEEEEFKSQGDFLLSAKAQSPHSPQHNMTIASGKKTLILSPKTSSSSNEDDVPSSPLNTSASYSFRMSSVVARVFGK